MFQSAVEELTQGVKPHGRCKKPLVELSRFFFRREPFLFGFARSNKAVIFLLTVCTVPRCDTIVQASRNGFHISFCSSVRIIVIAIVISNSKTKKKKTCLKQDTNNHYQQVSVIFYPKPKAKD